MEDNFADPALISSLIEETMRQQKAGEKFSEIDRATVKAVQEDLLKRGYPPQDLGMQAIERASRDMGNKPSPGYPDLDKTDAFKAGANAFYKNLNDEQKSFFVNPLRSPPPEFMRINHGDGGSKRINPRYEQDMEAWEQDEANLKRFEKSLSPEQLKKWWEIKKRAEAEYGGFKKPKDNIPTAPNASIAKNEPAPSQQATSPIAANPASAAPPVPAQKPITTTLPAQEPVHQFGEHYKQDPGHYTVEPDVMKAQEGINKLKDIVKKSGLDLGIELGITGPNHDGVDGKFGDLTFKSVDLTHDY